MFALSVWKDGVVIFQDAEERERVVESSWTPKCASEREFTAGRGKWELCTLTVGGLEGLHDPSKRLSVCEARGPHGESLGWKESQEIGKEAYGVEGKSHTLQCLETK